MARKAKTGQFPGDLFVVRDEDTGDPYFIASEDTEGVEDGCEVAIYQLVEVKRMKVTRELE